MEGNWATIDLPRKKQFIFSEKDRNFEEAKAYCENIGGRLPQIESIEENVALQQLIPLDYSVWLNVNRVDGVEYWEDGEKIYFSNWKDNTRYGSRERATFNGETGFWEEEGYNSEYTQTACEKEAAYAFDDISSDLVSITKRVQENYAFLEDFTKNLTFLSEESNSTFNESTTEKRTWHNANYKVKQMQYLLIEGSKTFDDAKVACEAFGGSLPQIHSRVKNDAIINMLPNSTRTFIWMNAIKFDDKLHYLDGENIESLFKNFGEFDNWSQCLALDTNTKKWQVTHCDRKYFFTVCQKEKSMELEREEIIAIESIRDKFNKLKANLKSKLFSE